MPVNDTGPPLVALRRASMVVCVEGRSTTRAHGVRKYEPLELTTMFELMQPTYAPAVTL